MNDKKNSSDLIGYSDPMSLDIAQRPMMVIDLFSGSYTSRYIGHEVLNLEKDAKDGRSYGYCPPYDNIDITSLGASRKDTVILGVTIVYVKKQLGSNDREIIAFCENATVHRDCIVDKSLNRYIDKDNVFCSYSIESDTLVNLMNEEHKFVIKINEYSNKMFRRQRFYKGKYPELDKKIFAYIERYIDNKNIDDDASFQLEIQSVDEAKCSNIDDNSKRKPAFTSGNNSLGVKKNALVSKQALMNSKYLCAGDHSHVTFKTAKGMMYMEGHHLIPCTYSIAKYYWDNYGVNIDCQSNIVCLCPTCHRQIHYGSSNVKRDLIEKLFDVQKDKLSNVGIRISIDELLNFYGIE